MLRLKYYVDCKQCVDGVVTKHHADSDAQGNKVYYTEQCDCEDGMRTIAEIDATDIETMINDLTDKVNNVLDKCNAILDGDGCKHPGGGQ